MPLLLAAVPLSLATTNQQPDARPRQAARAKEGTGATAGISASQVLSDVTPDNDWTPGAQYANNNRRARGSGPEPEPGQAARLVTAIARARDAVRRVRELDPNWRPQREALYGEGPESEIRKAEDLAEEAEARIRELTPPIVPKARPSTAHERNAIIREIGRWLLKNRGQVIEGVRWIREYEATIDFYLDPPRTLDELQKAASKRREGYDIHHVVEQTPAEQAGFSRSKIDHPDNLVSIPRMKHWQITGWFGRANKRYGDLSPREYLRGKGWDERVRVGRDALIEHGVLKP